MADLAVLIVAYRAEKKLKNCLDSVRRYLPECEIHVWDNSGPTYRGVRLLSAAYPSVNWTFSDRNIGFAAAVNRLAAAVPGKDMLLLNPDAELISPITRTRQALGAARVAAAAPLNLEPDVEPIATSGLFSRSRKPWDGAHREGTFLRGLGSEAGLGDRLRGSWLSSLYRTQPEEVTGYLCGACLAINRVAWDVIGPFNEEFFLYGEEADWQRRARTAGWKLLLADEFGVEHQAMGTVEEDPTGARRSYDLLRAGKALSIEYGYGKFAANCFLSWCGLVEVLRLRLRHRTRPQADSDFLLTVKGPQSVIDEKLTLAARLMDAGIAVTVMSLQRLGTLPRDLPASARLVRGSWWWPSTAPQRLPQTLVVGSTAREKVIARLYALRPGYRLMSVDDALKFAGQADAPSRTPLIDRREQPNPP